MASIVRFQSRATGRCFVHVALDDEGVITDSIIDLIITDKTKQHSPRIIKFT